VIKWLPDLSPYNIFEFANNKKKKAPNKGALRLSVLEVTA
jgi:hypothetical protein